MLKVRSYIKKKKIRLKYFVDITGYTKPYISAVLNGKRTPSISFKKSFMRALEQYLIRDKKEIKKFYEEEEQELKDIHEELGYPISYETPPIDKLKFYIR